LIYGDWYFGFEVVRGGNDVLKGDDGPDQLSCQFGDDKAFGGKGSDSANSCESMKGIP
jgi:Ca2+-binding RTX toxin-like protein